MSEEWYPRTLKLMQWPRLDTYIVVAVLLLAQFVPALEQGGLLRVAVVLPLLFFLPGYALLLVVYPYAYAAPTGRWEISQRITVVERVALSFGMSLAITSLIAIALTQIEPGFSSVLAINSVSTVVLVLTLIGTGRRYRLSRHEEFTMPIGQWVDDAHEALVRLPETRAVVSVVVVVSAVATAGALGFVVTQPKDGAGYTGFRLVQEGPSGDLVAANYSNQLEDGEASSLIFSVENDEAERVQYSVLIVLQQLSEDGTVQRQTVLDQYDRGVGTGETWNNSHTVAPPNVETNSRITYLLYKGDPPRRPTVQNSYRHLYLWIDDPTE